MFEKMTSFDKKIVLISRDKGFAQAFGQTSVSRHVRIEAVASNVIDAASSPALAGAAVVVADLDARNRDELVGLQSLMGRLGSETPVIVITESFDDAVGRWFLQIRVSDFLRKPVQPSEVYQACMKTLSDQGGAQPSEIITFTAAQGGVGNTTMAVETAMQLVRANADTGRGVCLVDLDFQNDACAAYLDVEPRVDLHEIGMQGENFLTSRCWTS